MAKWVVERPWFAWGVVLVIALLSGWATSELIREQREEERLSLLQTETERRGIEIMSQTLNGNVMGALGLLGTIDSELKREARGESGKNDTKLEIRGKTFTVSPTNIANLESVGRSYDAEGTFIVRKDGWIGAGWDNAGKPSTGLNVKFRPYYQMAMQGMENVYAAVSQARGDRMLYFSAPIYAENTSGTEAIGAVVARTGLLKIDNLLRDKADIALLLSPQNVVFASSKPEWVAHIAGKVTPERLQSIRNIKQFGDLFVSKDPLPLPVSIDAGVHPLDGKLFAVARAKVQWNDPLGDWTLVLLEDLSRTVPLAHRLKLGSLTSLIVLVLGILLLRMLRGHHVQVMATRQLNTYAQTQQIHAERKSAIAAASLRLQQTASLDELAHAFLTELHTLIGLMQGVVYIAEGQEDNLRLAGSYGCISTPAPHLIPGDGLLGQCAIERRQMLLDTPQDERQWQVHSGLGSARPKTLILSPILLADHLLGVMEAAFLTPLDEDALDSLAEMGKMLAMNIEILRRSARTQSLLESTVAAERASAEQAHFQQVLVDTIPYPVFYKGPDARFLGVNLAYEETFKVLRADLVGKRVLDLDYLPEADRLTYQAEDEAVIANASQVRHEIQIPLADGKLHDTLYSVSGFRNADGTPGGLVGTFIDVSEQKEATRELDRLADLERFHKLAHGRETRILELKREINALAKSNGQAAPYNTELVEPVGDHDLPPNPDYRTELIDDGLKVQLDNLVDLQELQVLLTNFCESVGIASAIIDLEGKVLAAARWQRACTDFHRVNPDSCARCVESDTELALQLNEGQDFTVYKCKNGMTDAAAPIIVEGRHLANVFIGQFHSAKPDLIFFRNQARQFGYDETDYLNAVTTAPIIDEARLPAILSFLSGFARMISTMSLAHRRADLAQRALAAQADMLRRERVAAFSLAEDAEQARMALEAVAKESQA
jgi:PAS domain S-box-containing protein